MMLELCAAAVKGSITVLDRTIGKTAIVATVLLVVTAVLHRRHEVDDRARSATVMVGQALYSPHRVVRSRVTRTLMLLVEAAVVS